MPNEANLAAGMAFIIDESVVEDNRVAITDAFPAAATCHDS